MDHVNFEILLDVQLEMSVWISCVTAKRASGNTVTRAWHVAVLIQGVDKNKELRKVIS